MSTYLFLLLCLEYMESTMGSNFNSTLHNYPYSAPSIKVKQPHSKINPFARAKVDGNIQEYLEDKGDIFSGRDEK